MAAAAGGQRGFRVPGCCEEGNNERRAECDQQRDGKGSAHGGIIARYAEYVTHLPEAMALEDRDKSSQKTARLER
jgi:hypothetical protein